MGDGSIVDFVMPLIIELVLICGIDILFIIFNLKKWLGQERIIKSFPTWKGTKKPFYWFVIWSTIKFVIDVTFILVFIFLFVEKYGLVMIAFGFGVWILLTMCQMGIYLLIEKIMVVVKRKKGNLSKTATDNKENTVAKEPIDSDSDRAE